MMFGYGGSWPFWETGLMWLGMIAILGLLVWGIYALVTSLNRKQGSDPAGSPPGSSMSAWPGARSTPRSTSTSRT